MSPPIARLTLAIELARQGADVRIVGRAGEHFPGSRGKGLTARTQEVLVISSAAWRARRLILRGHEDEAGGVVLHRRVKSCGSRLGAAGSQDRHNRGSQCSVVRIHYRPLETMRLDVGMAGSRQCD